MNVSILEPADYHKLDIKLDPATSIIAVARDNSNEIKGFWAAQAVIHIEPIQLTDEAQDGGHTAIKLLQLLLSELAARGEPLFYAFSNGPDVVQYLQRLGLQPLPYACFVGINPLLQPAQEPAECLSSQPQSSLP